LRINLVHSAESFCNRHNTGWMQVCGNGMNAPLIQSQAVAMMVTY